MTSFKTVAMVQSLEARDEVTILEKTGDNQYIAEYEGKKCTAIYNWFNGCYYVDDVYGIVEEKEIK